MLLSGVMSGLMHLLPSSPQVDLLDLMLAGMGWVQPKRNGWNKSATVPRWSPTTQCTPVVGMFTLPDFVQVRPSLRRMGTQAV